MFLVIFLFIYFFLNKQIVSAKDVDILTSTERGENVTVIACCNADGQFIPPVVIF